MIGIYKITNKINGKAYIGQSVCLERRFAEHKRRSEQQIDQAIQKYGIENFTFEVIEECNAEELNDREEYWTLHYNSIVPNGYNIGVVKTLSFGENNGNSIYTNEDIKIIRDARLAPEFYSERNQINEGDIYV